MSAKFTKDITVTFISLLKYTGIVHIKLNFSAGDVNLLWPDDI